MDFELECLFFQVLTVQRGEYDACSLFITTISAAVILKKYSLDLALETDVP